MPRLPYGLTDEELLATELEIDNPESLEGLIDVPPDDPEGWFVEFRYLSKDRDIQCVHRHHRHRDGYVLRRGDERILVGNICAGKLYGVEAFGRHKRDFDGLVQRRNGLLHRRDVADRRAPLLTFLREDFTAETFDAYEDLCFKMMRLPFIWRFYAPHHDGRAQSPRIIHESALNEVISLDANLRKATLVEELWSRVPQWLPGFERRVMKAIDPLETLLDFFQPAVLTERCAYANQHDMTDRRYEAGLLTVAIHRTYKPTTIIQVPPTYRVPARTKLRAIVADLEKAAAGRGIRAA